MNKLTIKQNVFVNEYIRSSNATKSAIAAGYSKRSSEVTGHRLLRNAKICEEINKRKKEIAEELGEFFLQDALLARQVLINVLSNPYASDKDKLVAARDMLDRAGFKQPDRRDITGKNNDVIKVVFVNSK